MITLLSIMVVLAGIAIVMVLIRTIMWLFSEERYDLFWHEYVFGDGGSLFELPDWTRMFFSVVGWIFGVFLFLLLVGFVIYILGGSL